MLKRLKLSDGLKEGSFKGNILGEDCKVHDFLLIGWSWDNGVMFQES